MKNELKSIVNFGLLIRLNREYQNLSLSTLADLAGVSYSQLSKIERGYEKASHEIYSCLFEALDIDIQMIENEHLQLQTDFWDFYKTIVYVDDDLLALNKLNALKEKYTSNYMSIEYLLCELMFYLSCTVDLKKAETTINLIHFIVDYLDIDYKVIFYDYYGTYFEEAKRIDKAILFLDKALQMSSHKWTTAMIQYHLGNTLRKNRQVLRAYQSLTNAKNLFLETNNYLRSCLTDLSLANIHSANGEYVEAIEKYKECIDNYRRIHISSYELTRIYSNLVWVHILQKNYEEAYRIIMTLPEDVEKEIIHFDSFYLYQIITYYELGKKSDAYQLCCNMKKRYDKNNITHNFIMYYFYINHSKNTRLKYLKIAKTLIIQGCSYSYCRLLIQLLRKECSDEMELLELNNLMYNYIFNSFEE